jgi:hypothetical protein
LNFFISFFLAADLVEKQQRHAKRHCLLAPTMHLSCQQQKSPENQGFCELICARFAQLQAARPRKDCAKRARA